MAAKKRTRKKKTYLEQCVQQLGGDVENLARKVDSLHSGIMSRWIGAPVGEKGETVIPKMEHRLVALEQTVGRDKAERAPSASIEAGSVVALKSGGPKMTVVWWLDSGVKCVWFQDGHQREGTFAKESVRLVEGA